MKRQRRVSMAPWLLLSPALLFLVLFFAFPVASAFLESLKVGEGQIGLANYVKYLKEGGWGDIGFTLLVSLSATVSSILISIPLVLWIRERLQGHSCIRQLLMIPLTLPALVVALGMIEILSDHGFINWFLIKVLHVSQVPLHLMYSPIGIVITLTWKYFPFSAIALLATIESISKNLEEAAFTCGASKWTVYRRVIFPMLIPGFIAGGTLTFMRAFSALAIPLVTGGTKAYRLLSVATYYTAAQLHQWSLGSSIAVIMAVIQGLMLFVYISVLRGRLRGHFQ